MKLESVPNLNELNNFLSSDDEIKPIYEIANQIRESGDYFSVGYLVFDKALNGGVTEGDLIVVSGRTGNGKTLYAMSLTYAFNKTAIPCLWFSYEMNLKEVWKKFEAMGCDQTFLAYAPVKTTTGRIDWLELKIKEGILKFNTKVVFIDHLGFLSPNPDKLNDSNEKNYSAYLAGICRQLKKLAIEKEIIIVLIAHTRKTDKDLDTDDIAYSYGISQEADFVFMVERQKTGGKKFFNRKQDDITDFYTNETTIKLVKNRRTGQSKIIKCQFSAGRLIETTNQYDEPTRNINFE